jgi:PAS domain S-box-containing protein
MARNSDERRVEAELNSRALLRASAFERRLSTAMDSLKAMAFFVAGAPQIDASTFHRFARFDHDIDDVNTALIWAPLVRGPERTSFVAAQIAGGISDFEIKEPATDGALVVAGERDEYLPAMFEQAYDGTPNRPGIDMLSLPERRMRADRARDDGKPIATPPVVIFPRGSRKLGFVVFWPVYSAANIPPTREERRAAYRGAVVSRIDLAALLPALVASSPDIRESLEFFVDLGGNDATSNLVGTYDTDTRETKVGGTAIAEAPGGLVIVRKFENAGRQWTVHFLFPPPMVGELRSNGPWAWLGLGLGLTGLATAFPYRERRRRAEVEVKVRQRTAELVTANGKLDQEVKERERSAAELRRWADAFTNAAFGIGISDARTNTGQFVNPALAAMLGRSVAEVRAMAVADLYADEDRARIPALMAAADRTGNVIFTARHCRKDGTTYPAQMNVTSVRDSDGTVLYRIASVLDITEAQRTEDALRQAQKMEAIGNLTGGMAHDFNNILAVIIGNLDLVRPRVKGDAEADEIIGECLDAALSGADLTRRLLAFARRQPLRPQHCDVNDLVGGAVKLLRRLLDDNIVISLDLSPETWPVVVDPSLLEAALVNLATNARDAMPTGGKLMIATGNRQLDDDYAAAHPETAAGDYALVEVSDTGMGMPPEVASRIFEPFFTTKERSKGTGLGLSMVFGFMKQSGGHINVYSEPGAGTTFRLYLPRTREAAETLPADAPVAYARATGQTVLAVEDNAALLRVVVRQLEELGYRVLAADGVAAALAILTSEHVDLLFSDVVMPGEVDGFALARQALSLRPTIKVVLTSGFPEAKIDGNLGSLDTSARLLSKPYRKEDLAEMLREALDF